MIPARQSIAAARLEAFGAALLFSTGGAVIKATTFSGWQVACLRSALAAAAVLAYAPESRRGWTWRVFLAGSAYAATLVLYVNSNKLTTAVNAIFLQATAPLYLLVIGPLFLREPVRKIDVGAIALLAVGFSLFFAGPAGAALPTAPNPIAGNILGALSGLTWALTVAALRWMGTAGGGAGLATVAAGNLIAAAACAVPALPIPAGTWIDWSAVGYLGLFQIGMAYVLLANATTRLPALETSMLLLAEPAFNPLWAWLVHGEVPGPWEIAGASLILAATILRAVRNVSQMRTSA